MNGAPGGAVPLMGLTITPEKVKFITNLAVGGDQQKNGFKEGGGEPLWLTDDKKYQPK